MNLPSMTLKRTLPFHSRHAENKAKFGSFGDWEVPLYFSGILEEHHAVRRSAGLFDISHMGKFRFTGKDSQVFLDRLLCRSVKKMKDAQALYMPLLNEAGKILDDIILYRVSETRYWMIVNAGCASKDEAWIEAHLQDSGDVVFENLTEDLALLALQGPASADLLARALGSDEFASLGYYRFREWKDGLIARTGYTGEDGFEIMASPGRLAEFWDALFKAGEGGKLVPAGFGARDTLRLEAGMLLYGHDMDESFNPFEAGIEWAVDFSKESFIGSAALAEIKSRGPARRVAGFEMIDRGIAREHYPITRAGAVCGEVTSGSFAPTLGKNIGLGFMRAAEAAHGTEIEINVRGRALKARVVKLPFYKRPRA